MPLPYVLLMANVRSLFNKVDELSVILPRHDVDVAVFVETWLSDSIPDAALEIGGFRIIIIRKDRTSGSGGGIAAFVKPRTM